MWRLPRKTVALVGISPYVLVAHTGLLARDVASLIALAKAKPGVISYSSVGEASLAHLAGLLFSSMAGVELNHVPGFPGESGQGECKSPFLEALREHPESIAIPEQDLESAAIAAHEDKGFSRVGVPSELVLHHRDQGIE